MGALAHLLVELIEQFQANGRDAHFDHAAIFGVGIVTYGYCPGTGIAAVATGSVHALVGFIGMLIGGILYAINYPSIDPLMGTLPGMKAFVAAVLGGIGNIPGAALGGVLLGLIETLVVACGGSTYRDAVAFAVLILILLVRPSGLLGKVQREKV